jgi:hypothetical protein
MSDHDHTSSHSQRHEISADADSKRLAVALALIAGFMVGEVVVGILVHSLALLSDAAHMPPRQRRLRCHSSLSVLSRARPGATSRSG